MAIRRRTPQSCGQIPLAAFRSWLKLKEQEALEEWYTAGYAREPELVADLEGFYRAGLASLGEERW